MLTNPAGRMVQKGCNASWSMATIGQRQVFFYFSFDFKSISFEFALKSV
jgi:hypothetical protein